jgi:hypothetical protein
MFRVALVSGVALIAIASAASANSHARKKQPPPEQLVYTFLGGADGGRPMA